MDTSIWIDHLCGAEPALVSLLNAGHVLMHPFVIGEMACGNLRNRTAALSLMQELPVAPVATDEEALMYIARHGLIGKGIGYIDVHLLAAVSLAGTAQLWTRDKRLGEIAKTMRLAFTAQ